MRSVIATAFALWLLAAPAGAAAQGAVFVVRHAERADATADSALSDAGHTRARRLAVLLRDAGITQIFTTNLQRTAQTAAPLAKQLELTATELPSTDLDVLLDKLHAATPRDRVLVVGHSNTVPDILRRLGVTASVTIGDMEYDNLFIVIPQPGSAALFLRLRY